MKLQAPATYHWSRGWLQEQTQELSMLWLLLLLQVSLWFNLHTQVAHVDIDLYTCCSGLQEDKQTEAFSGRKILDEQKVVYDISMRSSQEQQPQLAVSLLASMLPCAFRPDT